MVRVPTRLLSNLVSISPHLDIRFAAGVGVAAAGLFLHRRQTPYRYFPPSSSFFRSRLASTLSNSRTAMAPISATSTLPDSVGNFDLVQKVKLDFTDVTVSKWRSKSSGLQVVHVDYNGTSITSIHSKLF